jgi:hypothetical protein
MPDHDSSEAREAVGEAGDGLDGRGLGEDDGLGERLGVGEPVGPGDALVRLGDGAGLLLVVVGRVVPGVEGVGDRVTGVVLTEADGGTGPGNQPNGSVVAIAAPAASSISTAASTARR